MRILILGAGAVGGYFGGRLIEAGADATFFVRPGRARLLASRGLRIDSPARTLVKRVETISDPDALAPFDLVLLACKAYDRAVHRSLRSGRRSSRGFDDLPTSFVE